MRNSRILVLAVISGLPVIAQSFGQQFNRQPSVAHRLNLPGDSPVTVVGDEWGGSVATVRGGAYQIDLHVSLSLRNAGQRHIRGITMAVVAQEAAPGGKASISIPSLDVAPGETFPVRGDLRLLRPIGTGSPMVEVTLDGILFDDLTFYGPDKLHSRRSMIAWELEARRDRQYFKTILDQSGRDGLQKELLASLAREGDRPQLGARVVRGRSTNLNPEHDLKFAFLHMPDAPVEPMDGVAVVAGNEAFAPKLVVRNRSTRPIRYIEIGWIVRDQQGRDYLAASVPAEMRMPAQSSTQILPDSILRLDQDTEVKAMTGYIAQVEFADGTVWIPSRTALEEPTLRRLVTPSPEEQRLVQIYSKRGVNAVIDELKKF